MKLKIAELNEEKDWDVPTAIGQSCCCCCSCCCDSEQISAAIASFELE